MGIMGIGPLLAIVGAMAGLVVGFLVKVVGWSVALPTPWDAWAIGVGIVLMALGVLIWLGSAVLVKRAYGEHRLVTVGVYGVSRNPMYAGFIVFLLPGVALAANELIVLLIPVAMFIAFKVGIRKEEEYLRREFGDEFERYRMSVGQLIPFVRL